MRIIAAVGLVVSLAHCASSEPESSANKTAASERALANVRRDLAHTQEGLGARSGRQGTHVMQVQSGHRHATIVTRAADGTRTVRCVNEAQEAEAMLRGDGE